jgi:antitoxin (DNA-binding transcriptional repressor) of toxin-antitoxin stability system
VCCCLFQGETWSTLLANAEPILSEVNIIDAAADLSALVKRVACGEEILIVEDGNPVAKLSPIPQPTVDRGAGCLRGQFVVPVDFDFQCDEIDALFYG